MTDSDLFCEFIIVIIELGAFMLMLSSGAAVIEIIALGFAMLFKTLRTRIKSLERRQHTHSEHDAWNGSTF